MDMSLEKIFDLEEELDREIFFNELVERENNIDYLIGFRKGIMQRRDIDRTEKLYYCGLIFDKINLLKGGKKK